jgi:hypothetical protein
MFPSRDLVVGERGCVITASSQQRNLFVGKDCVVNERGITYHASLQEG